jgi:hypothetical protein
VICSDVGKIVSDAEMKRRAGCNKLFGTVRFCDDTADRVKSAYIVTRLGVEDLPGMPHCDFITDTHFYLINANINKGGPRIIERQLDPADRRISICTIAGGPATAFNI